MATETVHSASDLEICPYSLDDLFDAIRVEKDHEVAKILRQNPEFVNKTNTGLNFNPDTNPQELFNDERWEYILTQDILFFIQNPFDEVSSVQISSTCLQSPLHLACIIGHIPTVEILLSFKDINLEQENGSGETSLSIACRSANLGIAQILLENGFKITSGMKDDAGNAPWDYLTHQGVYPRWANPPQAENVNAIVKAMVAKLRDDFPQDLLFQAAGMGYLSMIKAILEGLGAMREERSETILKILNSQDKDGWTALHFAAVGFHTQIVEELLESGADPELSTFDRNGCHAGFLALHVGMFNGKSNGRGIYAKVQAAIDKKKVKDKNEKGRLEANKKNKGWKWQSGYRRADNPIPQQISVQSLIHDAQTARIKGEKLWCHLPANNVSVS